MANDRSAAVEKREETKAQKIAWNEGGLGSEGVELVERHAWSFRWLGIRIEL